MNYRAVNLLMRCFGIKILGWTFLTCSARTDLCRGRSVMFPTASICPGVSSFNRGSP
jgi:hypothetical protein